MNQDYEIAGWIASPDGRVFFIGTDKAKVETEAKATATPVSRYSMNRLAETVKDFMAKGYDVVLLDELSVEQS